MASNKLTKIVVPCRLSYAHIWEPKTNDDGTPDKYSVCCLVDKGDSKTLGKIKTAVDEAIKAGKHILANKEGKVALKTLKLPLRDADDEEREGEEYRGMMFFNATSRRQPGIVNRRVEKILDRDEVYSGCYCNVSVNFYAFSNEGNKGVAVGLNNIQKVKDGERLSGGSSAEEDFEVLDDEDEDFLE